MEAKPMQKVCIVVVGPTASGKSALAIELCKKFNLEIVNADAIQLYKGLPISTAMVQGEEMCGIPHHCLGVIPPESYITVTTYQKYAHAIIDRIYDSQESNGVCIVGGTTYYIESILFQDGIGKCALTDDNKNTVESTSTSDAHNPDNFKLLSSLDPEAAKYIHPNDDRKIRRALEIFNSKKCCDNNGNSGCTLNESSKISNSTLYFHNPVVVEIHVSQNEEESKDKDSIAVKSKQYLDNSMEVLGDRINRRVDKMIENGLISEITRFYYEVYTPLLDSVISVFHHSESAKAVVEHASGEASDGSKLVAGLIGNDILDANRLSVRDGILEKLRPLWSCDINSNECSVHDHLLMTVRRLVTEYGIFQTIGFKEFIEYLDCCYANRSRQSSAGAYTPIDATEALLREEATARLKLHTVKYAKKQLKWLRNKFLPQCHLHDIPIVSVNTCDIPLPCEDAQVESDGVRVDSNVRSLEELFRRVEDGMKNPIPCRKRSGPSSKKDIDDHLIKKRLLYHCETCNNRVFQGLDQFNAHIASKIHKNAKKAAQRREKYMQYKANQGI